jgi:pimeloyl-ACP methyl ester carboxylesterase
MSLIVFSHGNSFPGATYSVMLDALKKRGYQIKFIDKFGHDPLYPVTNNWPHLVEQLADFVRPMLKPSGGKAILVGHSLGGIVSILCASKYPELAQGVVLLDSPVIGGWRAKALQAAKSSGLMGSISPGKISQRRTQIWPSAEAAYNSFKSKRAFARWHDACLRDYIAHGTTDGDDGKRHLAFDRRIETQIYNTLPDHLESILRKHPLQCKAAFVGGLQSEELKQTGTETTAAFTQGRMLWMDGTHLFPMEKPFAAAAMVDAAIASIQAA